MAATDVKLLQETSKNILKAAESKEPASTIITMLASLDSFKATEDLLRQSKIGVAVTKLRQHQDKKVAEAAGRLVNRWKQEVNQHKKKRPTEGSPVPANKALNVTGALNGHGSATQSPASQSTPSAIKKESTGRKSTVAPEKRNTNTDAVEYKLTNDPTRDGCLKLMYDGIAFMSNETPDDVLDIARKVELAAFEHFNETNGEYKSKIRSLYQNLKMKGNSTLRENVYSGKIPPKNFGMSSAERGVYCGLWLTACSFDELGRAQVRREAC